MILNPEAKLSLSVCLSLSLSVCARVCVCVCVCVIAKIRSDFTNTTQLNYNLNFI